MPMKRHTRLGFTLLELLVALTITVFIGIGSYAMLRSVTHAQAAAKRHSEQLVALQKAVWLMTEDFEQMLPSSMNAAPPALGRTPLPLGRTHPEYDIQLTRKGWSNPLGLPRSNLMRVAYKLDGQTLKRFFWSADDENAVPQTQVLLTDVMRFSVQPLSPRAMEILFFTTEYGAIRRVIEVPG